MSYNIKSATIAELNEILDDLRSKILHTVSNNGGHLSSSLGATEIIIAMHYVFDYTKDPFIFDVGHQAYAHKLLTGREGIFDTLRQFNGMSGFVHPKEGDYFIAGHSSTSVSLAVGAAKAIDMQKAHRIPVVLIGDGAMSAGLVYEALNDLGHIKLPVIIILNDNEMSISKPIGAISNYLSQLVSGRVFQGIKAQAHKILDVMPESATYIAKKMEESIKLITPGILFEELGIDYVGPINGHDIKAIIDTLKRCKELKKPVIIHAQTIKGKGYKAAEGQLEQWHGVSPFDIKNPTSKKASSSKSVPATKVFANALCDIASKDEKVVGVTAAMPSGTGLNILMEKFPKRFWDVGICEQHSVTSMAALAKEGFKAFVVIYSTFLQRAYDQIIHDVSIMSNPVKFAIDRAGIVGEDGETHQGAFDIAYLRAIPNMVLCAPRDDTMLEKMVDFAYKYNDSPIAFRYPRGSFILENNTFETNKIDIGKSFLLKDGNSDTLFIGYGDGVGKAYQVMDKLDKDISLLDLCFVKPLDKNALISFAKKHNKWFIFSDSAKMGGVGSAILELLAQNNILNIHVHTFEYGDFFIPHGNKKSVEKFLKIDIDSIVQKIIDLS